MPILGSLAGGSARGLGGLRTFGSAVSPSFESIMTVEVSSATQPITFSSIPQTFSHLQLRMITRSSRNAYINNLHLYFNSGTATIIDLNILIINTSLYTGTNGNAFGSTQTDYLYMPTTQFASNIFGGYIFDIYDYTNTNKNKVIHAIGGALDGGSNSFGTISSKTSIDTAAVTSITLRQSGTTNFEQYSHLALYGIKG